MPLQEHRGYTTLASPCQATRESWPQSTPAASTARTTAFKQLASQHFINAEVDTEWASEEVTTSPERATEEKLPSVQLASLQGSEPGWQVENSTL